MYIEFAFSPVIIDILRPYRRAPLRLALSLSQQIFN